MKEIPISYLTVAYHLKFNCLCVPELTLQNCFIKDKKSKEEMPKIKTFPLDFHEFVSIYCICKKAFFSILIFSAEFTYLFQVFDVSADIK